MNTFIDHSWIIGLLIIDWSVIIKIKCMLFDQAEKLLIIDPCYIFYKIQTLNFSFLKYYFNKLSMNIFPFIVIIIIIKYRVEWNVLINLIVGQLADQYSHNWRKYSSYNNNLYKYCISCPLEIVMQFCNSATHPPIV